MYEIFFSEKYFLNLCIMILVSFCLGWCVDEAYRISPTVLHKTCYISNVGYFLAISCWLIYILRAISDMYRR